MNHRFKSAIVVFAMLITASSLLAQARVSPHETLNTIVEAGDGRTGLRLMLVYGRPYSKAPRGNEIRKIWGTLVPYGKVWRTGADEATHFITPVTLEMGGVTIPAGTYTLWTLPQSDGSAKLIINKAIGIWGESYDEKQDLARVDLKKAALDKDVDQFTMSIDSASTTSFVLKLEWEKTQYAVPFTVKK
jgi:Protein of unknown function (DUF2911)